MIADVPPFYVQFLKSIFSQKSNVQSAEPRQQAPVAVRLLPKPEVKKLEQPVTALTALPAPVKAEAAMERVDILSLPNRDGLRRVVRDPDYIEYE